MKGFNFHQLDNAIWKRNFQMRIPRRRLPRQVAFGEDSKVVVGGSDHGAVYVFDKKTGSPLHVLRHGERGMVQTLTVRGSSITSQSLENSGMCGLQTHDTRDTSTIVSASSSNCEKASICVWVRKLKKEKPVRQDEQGIVDYLAQLVLMLGFVAFVFQNAHVSPSMTR